MIQLESFFGSWVRSKLIFFILGSFFGSGLHKLNLICIFFWISNRDYWVWWDYVFCYRRLSSKLWVFELHHHHKPMQRTTVPCRSVLCFIQGIGMPLYRCIERLDKRMCFYYVQLHQPLRKLPSWPFCQWVPRGEIGSWMPCITAFNCGWWCKRGSYHLLSISIVNAHSWFPIVAVPVTVNLQTIFHWLVYSQNLWGGDNFFIHLV